MKIFKIKLNNGFVILFAVTLSAILLSIALGVANISFKEVSFSTSARDSNDAFLAADAAVECTLFYDKLANTSFPIAGPATSITCGSTTTTPTFAGTPNTALYNFVLTGLGNSSSSCAKVEVFKDKSVTPTKVVITSTGYNLGDSTCNSTNVHRVERELIVSSYVGATPIYTPPASSVDIKCNGADSCSIAYNSSALLSWTTSASITSCTADAGPWSGNKSWPSGSENTSNLTSTQTYTITCTGVQGSAQDSVVVTVSGAPTPTVITNAASSITSSGATLNGSANPNGYAATGWYRYSATNPGTCNDTFGTRSPASGGTALGSGSAAVAYTSSISGLSLNTTYYYCAIASNTNGTGFGAVSSFTTSNTCSITGGTIVDSGGFRTHTFTNSGTFTSTCAKSVYYIVVAGGGGGGSAPGDESQGGGGGGGGVLSTFSTPFNLPANTYNITVGNGGGVNGSGGNSSISGVATAIGGGAAGSYPGGSGGGANGSSGLNGQPGGAGTPGQGYAGGNGIWGGGGASRGAGGGGAGGVGSSAPDDWDGGAGGTGVNICLNGCAWYSFGGGGGAGAYYTFPGTGGGGEFNTGYPFGKNPSSGINGVVIIIYAYP